MTQLRPIGCCQIVVGRGHFEKPKLSAFIKGDMMFQSINPFIKEESLQNQLWSRLESIGKIYRLSIQVQLVVYNSTNP